MLTPIRWANGNARATTTVIYNAGIKAHTYIRTGRRAVTVVKPTTAATSTPATTSKIAKTPGRLRCATAETMAAFVPRVPARVTGLLISLTVAFVLRS